MTSRKEQKQALREERLARERELSASRERKKLIGYVVAGVVGAGAVIVAAVLALGGGGDGGGDGASAAKSYPTNGKVPAVKITELRPAAKAAGCTLKKFRDEGSQHVTTPVRYRTNPPTSGNHVPPPVPDDGAYPEAPPKEGVVHLLEHSRIAIQFKPTVPDSVRANLKALFDEDPYHVALLPNTTKMPYQVAATAWARLLGCEKMNDRVFDAIRAFRDEYRDRGPEQPVPP